MAQPNISSELLRTLIAVVEQGGFIRAAEYLHKTQSTISQQMKKLEHELGVEVFKTVGRRRELTNEGEMLLGYAKRLLALQDDAIASLRTSGISGEVRLGVSQGVAEIMLPELLAGFASQNPEVRLFVETGYSPDLIAAYERGEYDLVITLSLDESSGKGELLAVEPLAWIAAESWEWSGNRRLPLATYTEFCQFRRACTVALDKAEVPWRIVYTTSSYQGLMAAVKSGLAITVRPESAVMGGTELVGARLGLPALPNVYTWLQYSPTLDAGCSLASLFKSEIAKKN
ncbi:MULTISPECIES: LysR substrate-binding domain-containing protein [unclassified Neptuniibacter]|uniref:LysR substrate-binding domain-containing protein n=1 Tax=unclassified Neptuniibacter TaxID=2630693 RepID=UPI0025EA75C1|nr:MULTISPECIES: LysR substrate-binding domain-containing protein [unclassified Neptuniibacter]